MWENFKSLYDLFILFLMGFTGGTGVLLLIYGSRKAELVKLCPLIILKYFLL